MRPLRRELTRGALLAALGALAALVLAAPPASAQSVLRAAPPGLAAPPTDDRPPPGRRLTARQVLVVAEGTAAFRSQREQHPRAYARAWLAPSERWQASLYCPPPPGEVRGHEVAQVVVDDASGRVLEVWTGVQIGWTMARGYPGAFGGVVNAPWVWLPLCGLFALPFLRPPWRLLHLDLAVLLAFSLSYAAFNAADLGLSVPSVYPLLAYLLMRMLAVARRRDRVLAHRLPPEPPLRLVLSTRALLLGAAALFAFRLGLNLADGNVIDVGYASVVGADRLAHGAALYGGAFPPVIQHGDTYGPVVYAAYVPFELAFPWRGIWDDVPAAHAAAIAFDAASALALWAIGRGLRGPRLGALLAYLWLAFPFTLMVMNSDSNDALVGFLVLAALAAASRPAARGALVGLAGMAKFAPLALLPLFADLRSGVTRRLRTLAGFTAAVALSLVPVALSGGLGSVWSRTLGFQASRSSPFSLWGAHPGLHGLQLAVQAGAVALALAVALWPPRRDPVSLAALAAAVLIALQLGVEHWFYLYLVWFVGPVWVALLAAHAEGSGRNTGSIASARRRPEVRMSTALSHGSSSAAS